MIVVNYGKTSYQKKKVRRVKNYPLINKFKGGLWTSPIDSKYGWRDFILQGNIHRPLNYPTVFRLKGNSKIYIIDSIKDVEFLPTTSKVDNNEFRTLSVGIDFEKLIRLGYDGVYLTDNGQSKTRYTTSNSGIRMYGWDVETVAIFNPEILRSVRMNIKLPKNYKDYVLLVNTRKNNLGEWDSHISKETGLLIDSSEMSLFSFILSDCNSRKSALRRVLMIKKKFIDDPEFTYRFVKF